jgi:hypothetical protein
MLQMQAAHATQVAFYQMQWMQYQMQRQQYQHPGALQEQAVGAEQRAQVEAQAQGSQM